MTDAWDDERLRREILHVVDRKIHGIAPAELESAMAIRSGKRRREIRRAVRGLVEASSLDYADRFGRTVIEPGASRPVRVSGRIVISHYRLAPPDVGVDGGEGVVAVRLQPGPSFGNGRHPTTRMALRLIDALTAKHFSGEDPGVRKLKLSPGVRKLKLSATPGVLDIGTGTGVLGIAALLLAGDAVGIGVDIDPWALYEARENARQNGLSDRFRVTEALPDAGQFDLIIANLRTPTLLEIVPKMARLASPSAHLVLSGMKDSETAEVIGGYASEFPLVRSACENGWGAVWLARRRRLG